MHPAPPTPNQPMPNASPPGSLADSRLGVEIFQRMRRAQRIQVATFVPRAGQENVTNCPPEKRDAALKRIAELLREDRLYISDERITGFTGVGNIELRLLDPFPNTRFTLFLKQHRMRVSYQRRDVFHTTELLLDPIAKPLLALLGDIAPQDTVLSYLSFTPLPPTPPAPPPAHVPPDILRALRAVRPGLRRTDLLRVLEEEGGLSTRLQRQFVYPKRLNKQGLGVKVIVCFAPKVARIRWIDGVGYPVSMPPAHTLSIDDANRKDDIIISVSEPFVQYGIYD